MKIGVTSRRDEFKRINDIPKARRLELVRTARALMSHAEGYMSGLQYKERCYVRLWIQRLARELGWFI